MTETRGEQRAEIQKGIYNILKKLRNGLDSWDMKQYILNTLFYRYLSEDITRFVDEWESSEGNTDFSYADLDDETAEEIRDIMIETKGYFLLPSQLFENVVKKARTNKDLNTDLLKIFRKIEDSTKGTHSERAFEHLFSEFDTTSRRLGGTVDERNKKLVEILEIIDSIDLGDIRANKIDAFGDAYEFLASMYSANAGKSGGEFFTPQEVSKLLTLLALGDRKTVNRVYDPAAGSAGLLLQAGKILGNENVLEGYYGQEYEFVNYNLARMNMFLHGIHPEKFFIEQGDTLTDPRHWDDQPFDLIVSNPPYSIDWDGDKNPVLINDPRFAAPGVLAPKTKADYAFVLHMLNWLDEKGTAAIVVFPGILYRGGAEGKIRKFLIEHNFVDAVIKMPPNLFYGTGIGTAILILKKNKGNNNDILFINAEEQFIKEGKDNRLTEENIQNILKWAKERKDIEYIVRSVPLSEIQEKAFDLDVGQYIEKEDKTVYRTIPEVQADIEEKVQQVSELRAKFNAILAELGVL